MFDQLVPSFAQSPQGQQALAALQAQGFAPHQAQAMLGAAVPAAAEAMRGAALGDKRLPSLADSNFLMNFTAAAVSGLIRGQGFMGSAVDGLQGVVGGYVAQVIAARFGLPKRTAGVIGAVITPMAIDFLWEKLAAGMAAPPPQTASPAAVPPASHGFQQHVTLPHAAGGYPPPTAAHGAPNALPPPYAAPSRGYGYGYAVHAHPAYHGTAASSAGLRPVQTYTYNPYGRR